MTDQVLDTLIFIVIVVSVIYFVTGAIIGFYLDSTDPHFGENRFLERFFLLCLMIVFWPFLVRYEK
jgi:hypothetical protein